ncbi:hypothetical protein DOPI104051_07335 [Dolosigranulum pigrum]|uniref:Uncharacterized protein n=1 Tax=Dolosigranulum pigrum ATCC 51524 TaxID=883103 RepID=H3ND82_9LACT|nr:hypothetical protein HMPREF9703_00572 [Dolosigranulum pigrum ATCC 51524]
MNTVVVAIETDIDTEETAVETDVEQVVIYEDENKTITAEVPAEMKDQYLRDLQDPAVVEQELAKVNQSLQARSSDSSVYYWGKDKALVAGGITTDIAIQVVDILAKGSLIGYVASFLQIGASALRLRQERWWQESARMILLEEITAVKITIPPNPGPGYPQIYRTVERV